MAIQDEAGSRETELERLARVHAQAEKASSRSMWTMLAATAFAVVVLVVSHAMSSEENIAQRIAVMSLAVCAMFAALYLFTVRHKQEEKAFYALNAEHSRLIVGRQWVTPAGVVGHAVGAARRGRVVTLAFSTGVVADYSMSVLKPYVE